MIKSLKSLISNQTQKHKKYQHSQRQNPINLPFPFLNLQFLLIPPYLLCLLGLFALDRSSLIIRSVTIRICTFILPSIFTLDRQCYKIISFVLVLFKHHFDDSVEWFEFSTFYYPFSSFFLYEICMGMLAWFIDIARSFLETESAHRTHVEES